MSWLFPDWDPEIQHRAQRTWIPEAGGWLYQLRDFNNAFSGTFVPDLTTWANAIGAAVVTAEEKAVPVAIGFDLTRVRRVKQPIPT